MNKIKIAVTGASGFVGHHILKELISQPVDVIAITRDKNKLLNFKDSVKIVELDISIPNAISYDLIYKPDVLIHLAWDGLPNYNSLHHFERELPNQYSFLKRLIESGLPSLLVTGTCFEYGLQSGMLSEQLAPIPSNSYGFAKDVLRRQLEYLQTIHQFSLTWARLFYVYGEGQSANSLYSQLKTAVSRGEKYFNLSGGDQLRDYLPIERVASILASLALLQNNIGIVNVCSGKPISVRTLVENWLIENDWEIKLNIGYYPYPDYEPMAFWGDSYKLDCCLGLR